MNLRIPQATRKGYIEVCPFGAFDWTYPDSLTRRGRVQGGAISALPSSARERSTFMNQVPFNPEPDGVCRTIKANYWKVSRANFVRGGGMEQQPLRFTRLSMNDNITPRRIFNIYGEHRGTGYAGNVWDTDYPAPALTTMGGVISNQ